MIQAFRNKKRELSGKDVTLGKADDRRIILQVGAYYLFLCMMFVDNAGKQNLLKYSTGKYLDNLGAGKREMRGKAGKATVTLRYSLKQERESATGIPKGSRASAGDGVYFETNDYAEIEKGSLYVDVRATCTKEGTGGNAYGIGEIKQMTDYVPFVDAVSNITAPENGADEQDEESYREAIYIAPESYAAAGPEEAYGYYARKHSTQVIDVKVKSPEPRIVEVRCLLENGELPGDEFISSMTEYLSEPDIKMLTDVVKVKKPESEEYEISMTYWINESDKKKAETIQEQVNESVEAYILWQKSRIGRDINQSELIKRVMAAGAKRVRVNEPEYRVINDCSVAVCTGKTIVYGGLEDD